MRETVDARGLFEQGEQELPLGAASCVLPLPVNEERQLVGPLPWRFRYGHIDGKALELSARERLLRSFPIYFCSDDP
jgi:hypothetical protein